MFSSSCSLYGHFPTWLGLFKYPCVHPGGVGSDPLPVARVVLQVCQADLAIGQFSAVHTSSTVREGYKVETKSPRKNEDTDLLVGPQLKDFL